MSTRSSADRFLFPAFTVLYFAGTLGEAYSKPFWFDELFSWHIARLPGFAPILGALGEGIDPNPPLSYLLIRLSQGLFGTGEVATRLPFVVAFWVALLFLFLYVRKRVGSMPAYLSVIFLCLTRTFYFAAEARPYALVLACCTASFFCWQRAAAAPPRRLALAGLSASLAVGLLSHLYAVMLFVPLAAGELYRSIRRASIDWPIWISVAAAALALIPSAPVMLSFRSYAPAFWSQPTGANLVSALDWFYRSPLLVCLLGAACLIGLLKERPSTGAETGGAAAKVGGGTALREPNCERSVAPTGCLPSHEKVALVVLLLLPFIGFVFARMVTNAYYFRYVLPTVVGIAMGLALLFGRLSRGRPVAVALLFICLAAVFTAGQAWRTWKLATGEPLASLPQRIVDRLDIPGDDPIVINEDYGFMEYYHYAPPRVRQRLHYILDPAPRSPRAKDDTSDRALSGLIRKTSLPVDSYRSFLSSHRHFHVVGTGRWLLWQLQDDAVPLRVIPGRDGLLIEVGGWTDRGQGQRQ